MVSTVNTEQIQQRVLDILRKQGPMYPSALIDALKDEGLDLQRIREALWLLNQDRKLKLTTKRELAA